MKEKPPIISDDEVRAWFEKKFGWRALEEWQDQLPHWGEHQREAQRDADVEWYEAKIREIFEDIGKSASHLQEPVEVAFYFYKKDWRSLKDKFLKLYPDVNKEEK